MNKIKAILAAQYPQDIKLKLQISLFYFISMLLIFLLFRLMFCIVYADTFQALSFWDKVESFIYGLRFDVSAISLFLGVFIMILFLPYPKKSMFIKICVVCLSISAFLMLLMLSADFFYFPEVKRHMTEDIVLAWRDKDFIVKYTLKYYLWILIFIIGLMVFAIKKVFKFIDKHYNPKSVSLRKGICVLLLVVAFVVLARRSNFSGMPLNLIDAYKIQKKSENI
ncbi:MAG: hypothetical protein LBU29_03140 [Endomicrobium sp.]|jgi:hypothetical protein|nr:hypothetical protein [Endomicrobium sp.]